MPDRGYGSSGSSRGSTPSPRSSKSYLEPLSIHKEPKQQHTSSYSSRYPNTHLEPPHSTLITPRGESSHSRSSGTKSSSHTSSPKSDLKPLSIQLHQEQRSHTSRDDIRSDKRADPRYYTNSFLDRDPKKQSSSSRKDADSRYYPRSAFYTD